MSATVAPHRGSLLVGAPLAGGLIALIGAANVLWLNAASFVSLPWFVLSTLPSVPVAAGAMALMGLASAPLNPIIGTIYYERVPAGMRGRVLGVSTAAAFVTIPAGALAAGLVIEAIGVGPTLFVTGLCYLAVTSAGLVNPAFREMERLPALEQDLGGDVG